ncbi:MAG TPA: hypothetical protein VMS76_06930 [Planctomycetota bacterium]|nr:hypothetical protein [Planctomycetota bacterium]
MRRRSLAGSILLALGACVGPHEVPPERRDRELTPQELRELLAKGTIQPVTEMQGEDAFGRFEPEMDRPLSEREIERAKEQAKAPHEEAPAEPAPVEPAAPPVQENPYLAFGERIKVNPDGTITKPYPLRAGTGEKMQKLLTAYGNFPIWTPEMGSGPSPPDMVKIDLEAGWDIELYQDLRAPFGKPEWESKPAVLADWLIVTAGSELLHEIEDFINLFAAGVPQIEIEAKIVEVTFTDILDIGVRPPVGVPMFQFPSHTFVKSFDSSTPNQSEANEALLSIGGVQDAVTFNAILEAVATNDNVSIISRPKIAVREGGRADIINTLKIPFLAINNILPTGGFSAQVAYQEVGVKLFVVPRVVGTQTVALNIDVEASQQSGSETLLTTDSGGSRVTVPVLSTRAARTTVYLQPGQAVILGGLISERNVEQVRKVPFLGDVPILNLLFRSKLTRKEQSNVLFFIRPRILQGVELHREF